jgi:hypothetical protein
MTKKSKAMSYEEWTAWRNKGELTDAEWLALEKDMDIWWEENRVQMRIGIILAILLLPFFIVCAIYDWFVHRNDARG